VRRLLRLALLVALAIWAWRFWAARSERKERAALMYADGSSVVLEPDSPAFERLAAVARSALGR
jgi:hypothetical protein